MNADAELVAIVDRDNRVTGALSRLQMRQQGLIYRATYMLVLNASGELFLQLRSRTKDMYPGYYDAAAGGVVLAGENYEESARREIGEELGIESPALEPAFDFFYEDASNRIWGKAYCCRAEGPFRLQPEEIDAGFFCRAEDVLAGSYQPLTPDSAYVLQRFWRDAGTEPLIGN